MGVVMAAAIPTATGTLSAGLRSGLALGHDLLAAWVVDEEVVHLPTAFGFLPKTAGDKALGDGVYCDIRQVVKRLLQTLLHLCAGRHVFDNFIRQADEVEEAASGRKWEPSVGHVPTAPCDRCDVHGESNDARIGDFHIVQNLIVEPSPRHYAPSNFAKYNSTMTPDVPRAHFDCRTSPLF